jgi:hypothetical protein
MAEFKLKKETVMADRYTKIVLTVIALFLGIIAFQQASSTTPTYAQDAGGKG